ncbi:MAG: D-alanine-D-alanine ligase, D-alanine-D-alanine ligase [Candidatus Peregrinibacteria bacterium GW2011_GWF2_38_29]|nr:MAG: D-alanine-D-alanine ligase, D-alanine-D-alanine ligase [Candidatus Peregrinibacteria bacterium GW2011_GWF2_38_29]HBB02640.1 D-alanine--D-alanine ligase A [Candidatus Peregrinibacteria bacterium]
MKKLNLGIIFGGRSGEHEVSLVSSKSIISHVDAKKYNIFKIKITQDGKWFLEDKKSIPVLINLAPEKGKLILADKSGKSLCDLDVVFPVLHGPFGEDGTIQGLFEMANVPYVGCGVMASSVAMDKITTKKLLDKAGVPNSKYMWFTREYFAKNSAAVMKNIIHEIRIPCFVKPSRMGSSVGISKVKHERDLEKAIKLACEYDSRILVEKHINGHEIECAVLGNSNPKASTVGEIILGGEFYDFYDKYVNGKSRGEIPAKISPRLSEEFQLMCLKTYRTLDCAGMARVDGFLSKDDNALYINEINTIPGFTSISMYPKMWAHAGIPYEKLIEDLIALAFDAHKEKNKNKVNFSSKSDWFKK